MYRCINDIFGYCTGTPESQQSTGTKTVLDYRGREIEIPDRSIICLLNLTTCGKYQTHAELNARFVAPFSKSKPKAKGKKTV